MNTGIYIKIKSFFRKFFTYKYRNFQTSQIIFHKIFKIRKNPSLKYCMENVNLLSKKRYMKREMFVNRHLGPDENQIKKFYLKLE